VKCKDLNEEIGNSYPNLNRANTRAKRLAWESERTSAIVNQIY